MIEKDCRIKLKDVKHTDYRFLYELLSERDPKVNISHKKMPTYQQHIKFVKSKPYSKWYIVYYEDGKIGSAYLSNSDEIGIHLRKNFQTDKLHKYVMNLIMKKNPRKRYLINVSSRNRKTIRFLKRTNFDLVQYTYELINSKLNS